MNKIIGEILDGRSSRFWALAAGGFVLALGGVLVCGLLVGAGVYAVTRLTVPEMTTNADTAAAETAGTAKVAEPRNAADRAEGGGSRSDSARTQVTSTPGKSSRKFHLVRFSGEHCLSGRFQRPAGHPQLLGYLVWPL